MMTDNYLCIHGHFYQPPRENPWLDAVEYQASARPYHDWNERITRECYGPNTRARVHGQGGRILKLINNYEYMSFNFGPTLLSWLESAHPWIYAQLLAADRASRERYHGHGNALAQVYNHIIMPLARRRDKITQIRWGLADFEHRFGRKAEGMWLAETAVDTETLDLMAQEGVKFTILSPAQAQSVRPLGRQQGPGLWKDVSGGLIDPTRPYRVLLGKSGDRFIDIFFYEETISRAVAYEKILASGEDLLARITGASGGHKDGPRLVSISTDGESYGHHFKFGDLALAWLLHHLEQTGEISLTNFGFFVENFPPKEEVKLIEKSSWSCAHGVERWRADCGCSVSHTAGWNQTWRSPLREGLDWLANELASIFEDRGALLFKDPWEARNDYVRVLLKPSGHDERELFLRDHAARHLGAEERVEAFQLLESQRMALYMFTSCGWFFDDISGLETTQVLKYAARALDLVDRWAGKDLEAGLIDSLVKAKSNDPVYDHGGEVYKLLVMPSRIDPSRAAAHHGLLSLIEERAQQDCLFSDMVRPLGASRVGGRHLYGIIGEVEVNETGIGRESTWTYMALREPDQTMSCLVGKSVSTVDPEKLAEKLRTVLREGAGDEIRGRFCQHIPSARSYGLRDFLPDTQRCLIEGLARDLSKRITDTIREQQGGLREILRLLEETGEPAPETLGDILRIMLSEELRKLMETDLEGRAMDWAALGRLAAQAKSLAIALNGPLLKQKAQDLLKGQMESIASAPDESSMRDMINFLNLAEELQLALDLWECQNMFYDLHNDTKIVQTLRPNILAQFYKLGQRLGFVVGEQ
jgi:alpha-amylase/alpha-mannosidase (GH57 family)